MDTANVVAARKEQRTRIHQAIIAREGLSFPHRRGRPAEAASTASGPGRHMSVAARKRMAKWKKKSAPQKAKGRPSMSAAARRMLSVLMKACWAAKQRVKA